MSRKLSVEMESDRPDPLPGFLASSPGSAATFDQPEGRLDQSEGVAPFRPLSMTLRSHSRAGRSKSPIPENVGSAVRTESEHPQPETEDASCAGWAMRKIPDSPDIDSSGETGKTPSGPTLHDRPGPEMEIAACPPVHPSSSTQTLHQTTFSTGPKSACVTNSSGSPSLLARAEMEFFSGSGAVHPHKNTKVFNRMTEFDRRKCNK